jgi:glutathione S-transferase
MTSLRLYDYAPSGNCYKVRLLLSHLGVAYERVPVDIFDGGTLTPEFERLNPLRATPVLELEDGRTLIESDAIMWFLASGTPFLPTDPADQADVLRWLIYEQTDVMPMIGGLRFRLLTKRFAPDSDEANARRRGAYETLGIVDRHLAEREFLAAGRYTIADMAVYGYSHVAHEAELDTSPYPAFLAWLDRVVAQPGFVDDLVPYPPNASLQVGRSTYG